MTFTKKKLAAVVSGSLLMGAAAQSVQAGVNLDKTLSATTTNDQILYASEIIVSTSGRTLADNVTGTSGATGSNFSTNTAQSRQNLRGTFSKNQIAASTDVRLKLDLGSSARFAATPALSLHMDSAAGFTQSACANTSGTDVTCPTFSIFSGGTTSDSSVTFDANTGSNVIRAGADFEVDVKNVIVVSQTAVTVDVTVTLADNFGSTEVGKFTSAPYITFAPYLSVSTGTSPASTNNTDTNRIDVTQNSLFFSGSAGDNTTRRGSIDVVASTLGVLGTGSTAVSGTDVIKSVTRTVVAANGFSAMNQGTSISGDTIKVGTATATVSTSDATMASVGSAALAATGDVKGNQFVELSVPTNNTVEIAETTLVGKTTAVSQATATYSAASATGEVTLSALTRNGSSARLTFALTPNGKFPMFVRFTNPSSIAGNVQFWLTNDAGVKSDTLGISVIEGVDSDSLAAGSSTGLLNINDVMAAVQANDTDFALATGSDKLRLNASANFGGDGASSGLVVGAFSISTDGTTFNMMTEAGSRVN